MKTATLESRTVVLVVIALLVSMPLYADDGLGVMDDTIDITTGLPPREIVTTQLPDNDPIYDVLWDLTHGVVFGYEPASFYSDVVGMLAANGYVTTTTDAGIHNIDLSSYEIIVIALGSAWYSVYTAAEVQAVQDFVAAGGGVLVMSENTDCPNENINPITQAFGVTCGVSFPNPLDLFFTDFAAHQIFDGVTTVYFRAAGELSASAPGIPLAWTDAGEEMIASVEPCRMLVTGDANFCDNDCMATGGAQNEQFILNIFECLATGTSPVEDSTWGTIKALYR